MRTIKILPPMFRTPEDEAELYEEIVAIRDAVAELQYITNGNISLANGPEADILGNIDSCIIDVVWESGAATFKQVDNPLGRLIQGAILLGWAGSSEPRVAYTSFLSTLTVTNNSVTLSDSGAGFTSYMANGLFAPTGHPTQPEYVMRISEYVDTSTLYFADTWPYTTQATMDGIIYMSGEDTTVINFIASTTTNGVWSRWLIF